MSIKSTTPVIRHKSAESPATLHPPHPHSTSVLLQRARTHPVALAPEQILQLQRAVGNRAVAHLMAPKPPTSSPGVGSAPRPVVQRVAKDAGAYSKKHKLGLPLIRGQAKYSDVLAYIQNPEKSVEHRRGLLKAWNKRGILDRNIQLFEEQQNPIRMPEDIVPKGEKIEGGADLSGWDSDDEKELDLQKVIAKHSKSTITLVRSSTGKELPDRPVLPMHDVIRIGRQVVKRDQYDVLPLVAQIGPIMVEYDNPGTKDIYATPLVKDGERPRWKRAGTSQEYNFANLTDHLEQEVGTSSTSATAKEGEKNRPKPPSRKRKFNNIMGPFHGKTPALTPNEAEAVGAISCDFMKGSGAMHFVELAEKQKHRLAEGFAPFFKQSATEKGLAKAKRPRLLYRPAERDGRVLSTEHTNAYRQHRNIVKPLVKRETTLFNTIARAAKVAPPSLWGWIRVGIRMKLEAGDMTTLLEPTDESVQAMIEELGITETIVIYYPASQKRPPRRFGTHDGEGLTLYHLGDEAYSETCPEAKLYEEQEAT